MIKPSKEAIYLRLSPQLHTFSHSGCEKQLIPTRLHILAEALSPN